jgi:polyhydroxyalkanoate synthesis regulator phasin
MTKKKKTVEFEDGWADELIEDGTLTQEDADRLMRGIIQLIEDGNIDDGEEGTLH